MIAGMIDGQTTEAKRQFTLLLEARCKPYILNDATIQHVNKVIKEQEEFLWIYEKQLSKWQQEVKSSSVQQREIARLQEQVKQWAKTITAILSLAEELRTETIEKVMAKSDLELGIELLRKFQK